jgi:hypothetical protein
VHPGRRIFRRPFTGRELLDAERAAFRDPRRRLGAAILVDVLLVRELDIELRDWKDLVALNRSLQAEGHAPEPTAFLVRGAHDVTLAAAFRLFAEAFVSLRLHVADRVGDAIAWLDLQHASADVERALHALRVDAAGDLVRDRR